MFPIILTPAFTRILLIGDGLLADKRRAQLTESGIPPQSFKTTPPTDDQINTAHIVYIVDYPKEQAEAIARKCRTLNTLVNIEDDIPNCDFHTPALVRRGDLLISISTNGKSPSLARRIKSLIEQKFGTDWGKKLDILAQMRQQWRSQGLNMEEVSKKTNAFLDESGWIKNNDNE